MVTKKQLEIKENKCPYAEKCDDDFECPYPMEKGELECD